MEADKYLAAAEVESAYNGETSVHVIKKVQPDPRAGLAEECVRQWGLVAGMPDGEDSKGRSRLRLATVDELVTRACDSAEALYGEFEKRGWLLPLPMPKAPTKKWIGSGPPSRRR